MERKNLLVVDRRLGGGIDLRVPAPQRVKREVLARGHRRHRRHCNRRDGPRVEPRRAGLARLPGRDEDASALRAVRRSKLPRQARRRRGQDHRVVGGDVVLVGEGPNVLDAQEEDRHEDGGHRGGSALDRLGVVLELVSIGNHLFSVAFLNFMDGIDAALTMDNAYEDVGTFIH